MRKARAKKRPLRPDPRFNDPLVTRFVNNMMYSGKKSTAFKVFYDSMDLIKDRTKEDGYETWKKAMTNVMPAVEVKARRVGGSTFQIPIEIRPDRRIALTIRWMLAYTRARSGNSMAQKLSAEVIAAAKGEGNAVKKREDVHRMAEANKAFSHFRV